MSLNFDGMNTPSSLDNLTVAMDLPTHCMAAGFTLVPMLLITRMSLQLRCFMWRSHRSVLAWIALRVYTTPPHELQPFSARRVFGSGKVGSSPPWHSSDGWSPCKL